MIKKFFSIKKEFGFKFTFKYFWNMFLFKLTKKIKFKDKVDNLILNYLKVNYKDELISCNNMSKLSGDYKVWLFWWQGIENAPELVKVCVQSIKKNFKNHEVVIVTKDNISNYVKLPSYIIDKIGKGITITHLSDILRACLLSEYGGVWMDATMLMTKSIENEIGDFAFYSNKLDGDNYLSNPGHAKWSAFFIVSSKNNPILINLKNMFFKYWQNHSILVAYLLIDYCLKLLYQIDDGAKKQIDNVPFNNPKIHSLAGLMFKEFNEQQFDELQKETAMFKLTYKFNNNLTEINNTYYKKIISRN